jgi:hypothetical protein
LQGVIILIVGIFMGQSLHPTHFGLMVALMLLVGVTMRVAFRS